MISMEEAARWGSLAWQALVERGNLQLGQKVLIHAGGKAIGIRGKGVVTSSADSPSTIHLTPRSEGRTTS